MYSIYTTFLVVNIVKSLVLIAHIKLFSWIIPNNKWSGKLSNIIQNFKPKLESADNFYVDFILHPLSGMLYYLSYRYLSPNLRYPIPELMVILESVTWEFLYEVWWWRPSITDLIVTPLTAALLLEACGAIECAPRLAAASESPSTGHTLGR